MNAELVDQFIASLPKHNCSLSLTHNEHLDVYQPLSEWLRDMADFGGKPSWRDNAARQRAIDTNEMWILQWYPDTPVAFHRVAAPTLPELLELVADSPLTTTP